MSYGSRSSINSPATEKPARRFRKVWRWLKRIGLTLVLLVVGAAAALLAYRNIAGRQWQAETAPQGPDRIEELFPVRLHDTQEWILLRGNNRHRPVILFLSGGPGEPGIGSARPFGVWTGLEREMVVATWDQPNTGKSEDLPPSQRHISRYVEDACEVTRVVMQRLGTDHIYIAGASWGSFLGILTTAQCSNRIAAFFGMGQLVSAEQAGETGHSLLREQAMRRHDAKAIQTLDSIGTPPWTREQVIRQHGVANTYGGMSQKYQFPPHPPLKLLLPPEFSSLEVIRSFPKGKSIGEALWPELHRTDLNALVPALPVPDFFLIGRFDTVTPPAVTRRYFDKLSTPQKEWIWFDHSAHTVLLDEPGKVGMVIRNGMRQVEEKQRMGFASQKYK
jgi:pimeloyl-ACP methyl ester carboxylesterase